MKTIRVVAAVIKAVDENGEVVDGDAIIYVCGVYMKERGELPHDTVVTTIMSNLGLYKALDKAGIKYEKTQVGDKYVCENMMANGHCLGGEPDILFSLRMLQQVMEYLHRLR